MSARVLFSAVAFTVFYFSLPLQTFSQDELDIPKLKKSADYWTISYYASGNLSLINEYASNEPVKTGYGGMIELATKTSEKEVVLLFAKNYITSKNEQSHFDVLELAIGPRIRLKNNSDFFLEFTGGGLMITRKYMSEDGYNYHYERDPDFALGFSAAVTEKFSINNNTGLSFKLRLLASISFKKQTMIFANLLGGITFNNKVYKGNNNKRNSKLGITLLAGANRPFTVYGNGLNGQVVSVSRHLTKLHRLLNY